MPKFDFNFIISKFYLKTFMSFTIFLQTLFLGLFSYSCVFPSQFSKARPLQIITLICYKFAIFKEAIYFLSKTRDLFVWKCSSFHKFYIFNHHGSNCARKKGAFLQKSKDTRLKKLSQVKLRKIVLRLFSDVKTILFG